MFHSFHQRARLGFKVCTFRRLIIHALPRKKKTATTTEKNLDKLPALWAHSSWRTRVGIDCPQWRPNNGRNCLSFYLCNQRLMQACNCWPFRERERERESGLPFQFNQYSKHKHRQTNARYKRFQSMLPFSPLSLFPFRIPVRNCGLTKTKLNALRTHTCTGSYAKSNIDRQGYRRGRDWVCGSVERARLKACHAN